MCQPKKAFTLVELLVVIAIIALLLAILMPALNRVREQARTLVCATRTKNLAMTNMTYAASHSDNFVPWSQKPTVDRTNAQGAWDERWPENRDFRAIMFVNYKIIDDGGWNSAFVWPKAILCPSYTDPMGKLFQYDASTKKFTGPMITAWSWCANICYGYNTERWAMDATVWPTDGKTRGFKSTSIKGPSNSMMFIDASFYQVRRYQADWKKYWDVYKDNYSAPGQGITLSGYGQTAYRHKKGANVVYFDGHCATRKQEDVYDRINNPTTSASSPFTRYYDPLWDVFGRLPMMR
jgi:prepilin-type N-terminal cleavage/methylation domain-containing protein/prepilin-type processing-associated H-X9-DG protein